MNDPTEIAPALAEILDAFKQGHWTRLDGVLNDLKALAAPHLLSIIGDGDRGDGVSPEARAAAFLMAPPAVDNFDDLPAGTSGAFDRHKIGDLPAKPEFKPTGATQSCLRGVHTYLPPNEYGWHICSACGFTDVTNGTGPVDMGANLR